MKIKLERIDDTAENIKTFWFRPEQPFHYVPGQFIEMTIPHDAVDDRGDRHWFTLSSAPSELPLVSITTKFAARSSSFKQALQKLNIGDSVPISSPMGDFVLPIDRSRKLVFIAGGIGITPFRSIIKSLHDAQETRDIILIYGARHHQEFAFQSLFESYGLSPTYIVTEPDDEWEGLSGSIEASSIIARIPDIHERTVYMSGPEPMVESLIKDFQQHGIPEHRLVGDYFPNYPV